MANNLPLREDTHLPREGRTKRVIAMVPTDDEGNNLERRGGDQVGFICTNIRSAFPDGARRCGIYE